MKMKMKKYRGGEEERDISCGLVGKLREKSSQKEKHSILVLVRDSEWLGPCLLPGPLAFLPSPLHTWMLLMGSPLPH